MATPVVGAEAAYGLCYGTKTSQPRTPADVVEIYNRHGISKMWLSPTNVDTIPILDFISAAQPPNIKVVIGTDDLSLLFDYASAREWVRTYIDGYATIITHVCVGDVIGSVDFTSSMFKGAMSNLRTLLPDSIKVSTFVNEYFLLGDSYTTYTRPSTCVLTESSEDLLRFLSNLFGSPMPLFVRIMPYFRIVPDNISVDNCILNDRASVYMHDNVDKEYKYIHAFDAMVDSIYCALTQVDGLGKVDIHVVTGWPTAGPTEWATKKNNNQYISNLIHHINNPTPRENNPDIFIYSLVDEDLLETSVEEFKHLGVGTLPIG